MYISNSGMEVAKVALFCWMFAARSYSQQIVSNNATAKLSLSSPLPQFIQASNFDPHRRNLSLVMSANYGGAVMSLGPVCTVGTKLALERTKSIAKYLNDYELVVEAFDDKCSQVLGLAKLFEKLERNGESTDRLPLTLGTVCTVHILTGQMMPHYNFIGLTTFSLIDDIYTLRNRYRNYFTMSTTMANCFNALAEFLIAMSWTRYAVISESMLFGLYEQTLVGTIEKANGSQFLGMIKVPYVSGAGADPQDIEDAVIKLSELDARIFVIQTSTSSRFACFLHRHKLFGPKYSIFLLTVFSFAPNDPIRYPWCTEQMVRDVLRSVFFFGNTNYMNLYGDAAVDSTGLTGKAFEDRMHSEIETPEANPYNWFYRSFCYDMVLGAGYLLDATEGILRKRNETLSDWIVSGRKFQEKGSEFVEIMKDALSSLKFKTMFAEVAFNRTTTDNSYGFLPIAIFQIQDDPKSSEGVKRVPVAVYETFRGGGDGTLRLGPNKMKWVTYNGQPPLDRIHIVLVLMPPLSFELYIVVTVLAALLLVTCCLVAVHTFVVVRKRPSTNSLTLVSNGSILFGNCLLLGYILVQPMTAGPWMDTYCMTAFGFLFFGILKVLCGMYVKLALAHVICKYDENISTKNVLAPRETRMAPLVGTSRDLRQLNMPANEFEKGVKIAILIGIVNTLIYTALHTGWFTASPMTVLNVNKTTVGDGSLDESLVYQHFSYECDLSYDGDSTVAMAIIGYMCATYCLIVLAGCFSTFETRSRKFAQINNLRSVTNCFFGTVVLLACAGLVAGAIFGNDQNKVRATLSFVCLACVILNLAIIFSPQIFEKATHHARNHEIIPLPNMGGTSRIQPTVRNSRVSG